MFRQISRRLGGFLAQGTAPRTLVFKELKLKFWPLIVANLPLFLGSFFLLCVLDLYFVPLTYDEAYNFDEFARNSLFRIAFYYQVPNNHVFYTMMVRILSSPALIDLGWPPLMRLANIMVGATFFCFLANLVQRGTGRARSRLLSMFLSAGILFGSSIGVLYFLIGRGYLLGSLLLVAGLWQMYRNRISACLLFAFSIYTVPTFLLYLVLPFLLHTIKGFWRSVGWGLLTLCMFSALYAPIWSDVFLMGASKGIRWDLHYITEVLKATTQLFSSGGVAGAACLLSILIMELCWRSMKQKSAYVPYVSDYALAAALSYLCSSVFFPAFVRNGIAVGFLLWVAIFFRLLAGSSRYATVALCCLATIHISAGATRVFRSFIYPGNPLLYPNLLDNQGVPFARHWGAIKRGEVKAFQCTGFSAVPCHPYRTLLENVHGIVNEPITDVEDVCVIGRYKMNPNALIYARLGDGRKGIFCY